MTEAPPDATLERWAWDYLRADTLAHTLAPPPAPTETEPEIELGEYTVQRRCPHRNADLTVFGEIESGDGGDELVCTLHGWRFDCASGRCLTAADHHLRIRRSTTV